MAQFIFVSTVFLNVGYTLCTSREIFDDSTKSIPATSPKADVQMDYVSTFSLPFGARISKHLDQNNHRQSLHQHNLTDELHRQKKKIIKRRKIVKLLNQKLRNPINDTVRTNFRPKNKETSGFRNDHTVENINDIFKKRGGDSFNSSLKPFSDFTQAKSNYSEANGILRSHDNLSTRLPYLKVDYANTGSNYLTTNNARADFTGVRNLQDHTQSIKESDISRSKDLRNGKQFIPYNCSCYWSSQNCGCGCFGSLNSDDFQMLSTFLQPCKNFSFTIQNSSYHSFPPNFFSNVMEVEHFYLIISNSSFDHLFDSSPITSAFQNVRFSKSALIRISGVKMTQGWNWAPLVHLTSASEDAIADIEIDGCGLNRLSSDFAKIVDGKVKYLLITDSNLHMVGSGAFSNFEHLSHFRLPKNKISSIRRTDLPPNPVDLLEIDLSDNQISFLDSDLFTEMPSIQYISLSGNPLRVISEEVFQAIIGKVFLPGLASFSLNCDCQLKWLKMTSVKKNSMLSKNLEGVTCRRPPHLRGTPFTDLSEEHLICSN